MPLDGSNWTAKPDVLSVTALRDWLRQQDGTTTYEWCGLHCVIHNYICAAMNIHATDSVDTYLRFESMDTRIRIGASHPRTYAAALSRCNEYLQETNVSEK